MLIYKAFGWVQHLQNLTFSDLNSIKKFARPLATGVFKSLCTFFHMPYSFFLGSSFFLPSPSFFWRVRVLGAAPWGRGSRKSTTRARPFCPFSAQNRTLDRFFWIFEAFERCPISAPFSVCIFSYTWPLSNRFRLPFWRYFCSIYMCFLHHSFHHICCIDFCRFVPTPTCKNLKNTRVF